MNITKRQREAAERAMLKHLIDTQPKYKATLDALIDKPNAEQKKLFNLLLKKN